MFGFIFSLATRLEDEHYFYLIGSLCSLGMFLTLFVSGLVIWIKTICREYVFQLEETTDRSQEAIRIKDVELFKVQQHAEQANRIKDKFMAVVSHELRTPLTPAVLAIEHLCNKESDEERRELLELIKNSVNQECKLIEDLLDSVCLFQNTSSFQFQNLDSFQVLKSSMEKLCREFQEKNIAISQDFKARDTFVQGDFARLHRVFGVILANVLKFSPNGSLTISSKNENNYIVYEFRDTGKGITPEQMQRIFHPFVHGETSLTRPHSGLGLGLAIGRAVMEIHGGVIEAESEGANCGSLFRIKFPVSQVNKPVQQSIFPIRIFYLEDDCATRSMLCRLLRATGFEVEDAGTIQEALEKMEKKDHYDLIISDIGLPDGSANEVIQRMRDCYLCPAIALSGFGMEEDLRRAYQAGFNYYIKKPIEYETLLDAIRHVTKQVGSVNS